MSTEDTTTVLKRLAPSMARWPRFMRALPAGAFWTSIGLLASGAGALWTQTLLMHQEMVTLKTDNAANAQMRVDVQFIKWQMSVVMYDHNFSVWVLQADWNRKHGIPPPIQPARPPAAPPSEEERSK